MFASKFLSDAIFGLALLKLHVYFIINYNDKIDCFTISYGDRSNWFETILQYFYNFVPLFVFMNAQLNISLALFSQNVFKLVAEPVVPLSQSPIFRFRGGNAIKEPHSIKRITSVWNSFTSHYILQSRQTALLLRIKLK